MNVPERRPVFWCGRPSDEDEDGRHRYIAVRFLNNHYSVDSDQLIAEVELLERDGNSLDPRKGLLKQFGGDSLRSDMLEGMMSSGLEELAGSEWLVEFDEALGFRMQPVD